MYSVGREASLDVTGIKAAGAATNLSTVLLSSDGSNWFSSGVQLLLAGAFPAGLGTGSEAPGLDQWSNNYQFPTRHTLRRGQRFGVRFEVWPNDKPFPLSSLGGVGPGQRTRDGVQALLMGSYASAAGCLFTYQSQQTMNGSDALISDESLVPRRKNYHNLYNFWDPSGFFHICNLVASGEPRLIADARRILETIARAQRPTGMLPHHFEGQTSATESPTPIFVAISGATLPATNL